MGFRTAYGNARSENGWRMVDVAECALPIVDLEFLDAAWLRKGAPLTILSAWLKYYDTQIAPIVSTVWGFSWENDVEDSNHLSGTALDINAPQWPWGERRMPLDLKKRIRHGLDLFEGTVFWGADWTRADEMHFQMGLPEGDPRNDAFAAKLRAGYLDLLGDNGEEQDMATPEDIAKAVWAHRMAKPNGKDTETAGNLLTWTDKHAAETVAQLAGPESEDQRGELAPVGWPQLGKNPDGTYRSVVDGLSAVLAKLDGIKAVQIDQAQRLTALEAKDASVDE